jgi:hypothetical protein
MDKTHTCETCGTAFVPHPGNRGRFCSMRCYGASKTGARASGLKHRTVRAYGHPVAPPSGITRESRIVLYDKIGPGPHTCHWCDEPVDWKFGLVAGALIADHLNHDSADNSSDNLVPACNSCNAHRTRSGGRARIKEGELTAMVGKSRTRAVLRQCEYCGESFAAIPALVALGKGRFCSSSCSSVAQR